ncbi:FkbM family methyltransferase [Hyphomicrobium sp.]|uniref:FkbM family methyltransferase n=1 Tax=Hyphomicrobium sp. TaxID=82 RepID=UPI0025B82C5E|nr:FkbM family methyltransferase [Hyphomicrobium sp.]MCC7253993.1 FkbM family methyltransferase [Hyphomicrobium sp.]
MTSLDALSRERDRVIGRLPADPLAPGGRIALYGAGFVGAWAVRWLRQNGIEPVACFDGNPERHGSVFLGTTVHASTDLPNLAPDLVFITARHAIRPVEAILEAHGAAGCSLDAYFAATNFDSFLHIHDHLLADPRSKDTLRGVLMAMLTGDCRHLESIWERDQYFCLPRFAGSEKETYVDAGAYVGDSIERFIWANAGVFTKIHGFEPADRQFAALKTRVERLAAEWAFDADAIELNNLGLSDAPARMASASASGQLQSMALAQSDSGNTATGTLDTHLAGAKVTFIKADVEGMELALLKGAAATISRFKPKLAVCVYHYPSDLLEITAFIRDLVPEYRFALRHHSPQLMETVLYGWVE